MGGPGFANLAMDGALGSMGGFGFFGADRVGFGSLLAFSEPYSTSSGDIAAWMWEMVGGATGQTAQRMVRECRCITCSDDYAGGIADLVPLKMIDDWAKAWRGGILKAYQLRLVCRVCRLIVLAKQSCRVWV